MDADKINRWLMLVANISVVAGIVFLGIEIRQNTESQEEFLRLARANAYQARAFAASAMWSSNAASPELIDAIVAFEEAGGHENPTEALATLSRQEWWHIWHNMLAQLAIVDNNFYQYRQGYLDEQLYQGIVSLNMASTAPLWEALGFVHTREFQEEVDRLNSQ